VLVAVVWRLRWLLFGIAAGIVAIGATWLGGRM